MHIFIGNWFSSFSESRCTFFASWQSCVQGYVFWASFGAFLLVSFCSFFVLFFLVLVVCLFFWCCFCAFLVSLYLCLFCDVQLFWWFCSILCLEGLMPFWDVVHFLKFFCIFWKSHPPTTKHQRNTNQPKYFNKKRKRSNKTRKFQKTIIYKHTKKTIDKPMQNQKTDQKNKHIKNRASESGHRHCCISDHSTRRRSMCCLLWTSLRATKAGYCGTHWRGSGTSKDSETWVCMSSANRKTEQTSKR